VEARLHAALGIPHYEGALAIGVDDLRPTIAVGIGQRYLPRVHILAGPDRSAAGVEPAQAIASVQAHNHVQRAVLVQIPGRKIVGPLWSAYLRPPARVEERQAALSVATGERTATETRTGLACGLDLAHGWKPGVDDAAEAYAGLRCRTPLPGARQSEHQERSGGPGQRAPPVCDYGKFHHLSRI
jgi:hypothetical protein